MNSIMIKYIIIAISITALAACTGKTAKNKSEITVTENSVELSDAQLKNADIQTGKIEQRSISSLLKVNGYIDVPPQNMVSVSVPLGGYLKSTKLLPGMYIKKGESIAIMEDQQYITLQQDYLTAKTKLDFYAGEYHR